MLWITDKRWLEVLGPTKWTADWLQLSVTQTQPDYKTPSTLLLNTSCDVKIWAYYTTLHEHKKEMTTRSHLWYDRHSDITRGRGFPCMWGTLERRSEPHADFFCVEASFLSNRMILVPVLLLCVFTGNSHLQRICHICCSDLDHNNLNTFSPCRCELWGAQSSPQWAQSALCGRQHRVSVLQLPQTRNYRLFLLVSATSRKTTSVSHLTLSIRICAKWSSPGTEGPSGGKTDPDEHLLCHSGRFCCLLLRREAHSDRKPRVPVQKPIISAKSAHASAPLFS